MKRRSGVTWWELLVSFVVFGVLLAMFLPGLQTARETPGKRTAEQSRMIGLAIHNYGQAHGVFPPGTICTTGPISPHNQYDVWAEAAQTGPGYHATSLLLCILPYMGSSAANVYKDWNYGGGVGLNAGVQSTPGPATSDIPEFYCPTRRSGLRRRTR